MSASHLLGGEIWWDCLPNGKYVFYLRLFRDCTGIPLTGAGAISSNSPAGSIPVSLMAGYPKDASPDCGGSNSIDCGNPVNGTIEEHMFKSAPVTLNGVPPAGGWMFSWTSCARPTMTNIGGACYFLRAFMFPYNDGTGNRNANPCFDNSPEFLETPKVVTCADYPFDYNNFAFDSELDSLYFDWAQPLNNGLASPVTFTGGYSYNNPLPGLQNFAQDAGQVSINTALTGKYVTCMKVTAYKFGQKVAEIYRDIPIILLPCTGGVATGKNHPPTLDVINDPLPALQLTPVVQGGDTIFYEMTVEAGDSIHFKLQSYDSDFTPAWAPQSIKFTAVGGNLGQPLNNPTSCLFNPPCATMTPIATQSSFTSTLTNTVHFSWKTECNHVSFNPIAGGAARSQYLFYFKMADNFCPAPSFTLITARINVISPAPVAPDFSNTCMDYDALTNEVNFSFVGPTAADTAQNFDYYVVYRGDSAGNYVAYDTIYDWAATSYTDVNPDKANRYYYMRTYGGCDQESFSSDTLGVINLMLTAFPPISPYIGQLQWTSPYPNTSTSANYEVWRQVVGSGTWTQVGTTSNTYYDDTANVCSDLLNYQIRLASGCRSFGRTDTFRDVLNEDSLEIRVVTVDNGTTAQINFPASPYGDVTEYHILKRQAGTWVTADVVPVGTPMPYLIAGSSADQQAEHYRVVSFDSCGIYSDTNIVATHNTIFLDGDLNPCDGYMRLKWNQYINWDGGVRDYAVFADITPTGGTTVSGVLLGTLSDGDTTFLHENLQGATSYCYYIVATDTSGTFVSTSNPVCIGSDVVVASQLQYMARTTVQADGSVDVWAFIDQDADVDEYEVQRSESEFGPWVTLGIVPKPTVGPYQVRFIDFSANSSSARYLYRIRSENSCGGIDTVSNYGSNVLLKVEMNENLTNQLIWYPYRDFDGNTSYNVYRRQSESDAWVVVETGITDTSFSDNIRSMSQGNGVFCYRVAAVESNNSLGFVDETGGPMTAFSNEVCVDHDSRGFYPNAFVPNSSIPGNREWKPQMLFEDDSEYEVHIVDRWGNVVFQSTDPQEGWDGTYQGQDAQEGVYFFMVTYRSVEGKKKEDRGTITLIR